MNVVKVGQRVNFRINGMSQVDKQLSSSGIVKRIDGAANPITRQVSVIVELSGKDRPPVVGLYAEGMIETQTKPAVMVSDNSLRREGDKVFVWVLDNNTLSKRSIEINGRDSRSGNWVVKAGLNAGEKVLRKDGSALKEGQSFTLRTEPAAKAGQ
jgi:multidrug efflux pump subunit AcrA (membrane-fusion protein)